MQIRNAAHFEIHECAEYIKTLSGLDCMTLVLRDLGLQKSLDQHFRPETP